MQELLDGARADLDDLADVELIARAEVEKDGVAHALEKRVGDELTEGIGFRRQGSHPSRFVAEEDLQEAVQFGRRHDGIGHPWFQVAVDIGK